MVQDGVLMLICISGKSQEIIVAKDKLYLKACQTRHERRRGIAGIWLFLVALAEYR